MTAYHYQCARCFCTIQMDSVRQGERHVPVVNGDLCSSCQRDEDARKDREEFDLLLLDDDDD